MASAKRGRAIPVHVLSEIALVHLLIYQWFICTACRECGMKMVPQHQANGGYRILCSCRTCRHIEAC
jgi:hypothetical protein